MQRPPTWITFWHNCMAEPVRATVAEVAAELLGGEALLPERMEVCLPGLVLRIRSNNPALLLVLQGYFKAFPSQHDEVTPEVQEVVALERPAWPLLGSFRDWPRETGKSGRKDCFRDLAGGRLIHKVRTGMRFLQSASTRIASGPCLQHPNQVVNFINSQYLSQGQQHGWLLCHAAAIDSAGGVTAIAGWSGGGKSTLMLHLLAAAKNYRYVTNDRMLIHGESGHTAVRGIAKWPRVNPGTICGNPHLHELVSATQLRAWQAMPSDQLWEVEEKHDVQVADLLGANRVALSGRLRAVWVLGWKRGFRQPATVRECAGGERDRLLSAIMKDAGPFHADRDGRFVDAPGDPDLAAYRATLHNVPMYEVSGGIDFDRVCERIKADLSEGV